MRQYTALKKLFKILTKQQRKTLLLLQILMILSSLLEVFWVFLIGFFIANISNIGNTEIVWQKFYQLFSYFFFANDNHTDFITNVGIVTIIVLFVSTIFSTLTAWLSVKFSTQLSMSIANNLYRFYLNQTWLFHTLKNSSHLAKDMLFEVNRMSSVFSNFMLINNKIMMVAFMSAALLLTHTTIAISVLVLLTVIYWLIYSPINKILKGNGRHISQYNKTRFKLIFEVFVGIKEVLLRRSQHYFRQRFEQSSKDIVSILTTNTVLTRTPKYLVEFVVFTTIILFIIYYLNAQQSKFLVILPTITLYVVAGLRLLPALQTVFSGIASIKNNITSFEVTPFERLQNDLNDNKLAKKPLSNEIISFNHNIKFCDVSLTYPQAKHLAVDAMNLTIKTHQIVGFVGVSGCGKTSILDLISGLISPDKGNILIDELPLTAKNINVWQSLISYVPQTTFLLDDSIKHNIAFGINPQDIDEEKIKQVLVWAHLDKVVANLEKGIDTNIGEQGAKLSGGQRQRIGIARALYQNTSIILLDEATSALDGLTEQFISDSLINFGHQKTIIIATHQLKTVKKCDIIYLIDQGKIIDKGDYQYLLANNNTFKMMSE